MRSVRAVCISNCSRPSPPIVLPYFVPLMASHPSLKQSRTQYLAVPVVSNYAFQTLLQFQYLRHKLDGGDTWHWTHRLPSGSSIHYFSALHHSRFKMAITAGLGGVGFKSMVMGEAITAGTSPPVQKPLVMSPSTVGEDLFSIKKYLYINIAPPLQHI